MTTESRRSAHQPLLAGSQIGWSIMVDQEQKSKSILARRNGEILEQEKLPRARPSNGSLHLLTLLLMLISLSQSTSAFLTTPPHVHTPSLRTRATNQSSPLECLQVAPPVLSPGRCQQTLMVHTFAASYGQPFVGKFAQSHSSLYDHERFQSTHELLMLTSHNR
jgi:hypothetical protein